MKHLIMVGACYLDTILSVPHFPQEDAKLRASSLSIRRGGNCPNSLEVLQQLVKDTDNLSLHLISCLPEKNSSATQRITSSFGSHSAVDLSHCLHREGHTEAASSYIIRSDETGSRTLVNHNGLPEMTLEEFKQVLSRFAPDQHTWWHFEGRIPETTISCIRAIREHLPRARVSVEIEKPKRDGLPELALEADVVFYSKSWAESRGHQNPTQCLMTEPRKEESLGLCTWSGDGAAGLGGPYSDYIECSVRNKGVPITVIDSVGAGDTFIAGMLFSMLCRNQQWDPTRFLRFAVDLATYKVQQEGFGGLGPFAQRFEAENC